MSDPFEVLPDLSWDKLESLYYDARARLRVMQREVLQQLHGSPTFRRTTTFKDEVLAHLRWSTRILQADTRVPLPVEWDSRHLVALFELGRVLNEHAHSTADSSSTLSLPPVTAATCLLQLLVFFKPGGVLLREVSLSPYCVVDKKQYYRLVTSAFVHVDATHLITNLTAALPDCLALEQQCGGAALAADLALLTLTSHIMYVGFAWLQKEVFVKRFNYYSLVTVGFSGVLFGLKVWAGFKRGGVVTVWGVPVPSRFSWVPTLALTHLCVPEASFPAHIAGVVAGILRAYCLEPVLICLRHGWSWNRRRRNSRSSSGGGRRLYQNEPVGRRWSRQQGSSIQQQQQEHQQQQQELDWRHLHHERWLQQQQQQQELIQQVDGNSSGRSRQRLISSASSDRLQSSSAGSTASDSGFQAPLRLGGDGLSVRRLLLDAGLQVVLAAAAAGLYFVMSRGEKASRSGLRASFWRR